MDGNGKALAVDDVEFIKRAERRIEARLDEIETAKADGRLAELIRDTPPVREQLAAVDEART